MARYFQAAISVSTQHINNCIHERTGGCSHSANACSHPKTEDLKYTKLRICPCFCEQGLHDSHYGLGNRGVVVPFPEGTNLFSTKKRPARG